MMLPGESVWRYLLAASVGISLLALLVVARGERQLALAARLLDAGSTAHGQLLDRLSVLQSRQGLWHHAHRAFDERLERIELSLLEQLRAATGERIDSLSADPAALVRIDSLRVSQIAMQRELLQFPLRIELRMRAAHLPAWLSWFESLQRRAGLPWPLLIDDCQWRFAAGDVGIRADCSLRVLLPDWHYDRVGEERL